MRTLLIFLAACGTSPSDAKDWVPSDIDQNATLDRIGAAGYQKLCDAFEDYVRDTYRSDYLVRAVCTANALQTTPDAVACGNAVNMCLDTLPAPVELELDRILAQAKCNAVDLAPSGCLAKVSQMKDCLDALGTEVDKIMFSLTCAAFGSPIPENWWKIAPPPACSSLATQC